jgi:hypothetical protein
MGRDFDTTMIRTGGARGHSGLLVTDRLVVNAPGHGRVELTPPRPIAMRSLGRIRDDAPLTVLADLGGGRFYHVAGGGLVFLDYDEAAPKRRINALVALAIGGSACLSPPSRLATRGARRGNCSSYAPRTQDALDSILRSSTKTYGVLERAVDRTAVRPRSYTRRVSRFVHLHRCQTPAVREPVQERS